MAEKLEIQVGHSEQLLALSEFVMRLTTPWRTALSSLSVTRHMYTSASLWTLHEQDRRTVGAEARDQSPHVESEQPPTEALYEYEELENFDDDDVVSAFLEAEDNGKIDTTSAGHLAIRRNRQLLYYLRLIENEIPKLVCKAPPGTPVNTLNDSFISIYQHYEEILFHQHQLHLSLFAPLTTLARNILPLISGLSSHR